MGDALVFVIDCNDRERIGHAREELACMLEEEELQGKPLLIYANKQDLPNALKPAALADRLGLQYLHNRSWHIQGSSAVQREGIHEGLIWIREACKRSSRRDASTKPVIPVSDL